MMIEPVRHNPGAPRRRSFTLNVPPREVRRRVRELRRRESPLARVAWTVASALLLGGLLVIFLYAAFLAPVEWNAADPDYRAGALDRAGSEVR